jgi:CDP-glucose 4,6-dehydratase
MTPAFWSGKSVFLTGHTGFKGSWLSLLLQSFGARVTGYALPAPTTPSLFKDADIGAGMESLIGDIRDGDKVAQCLKAARPDIVLHLAAQPLVRYSYENPVETYSTNVLGLVNLLEAVRKTETVRAVVNVTSDKCYENREWPWAYRENEPMGGFDPYSNSKGCAELVTSAYRQSFFHPDRYSTHGVALGSGRAGNVIAGGDWAADRLVPDIVRALLSGKEIVVRNPASIRPWQHVLEPLSGYLTLAERLFEQGPDFAEGWNFGSTEDDARPVHWIVDYMVRAWGEGASWRLASETGPHEAHFLKLDSSKARARLGWRPKWSLATTLESIVEWNRAYASGTPVRTITLQQISDFRMRTGCAS